MAFNPIIKLLSVILKFLLPKRSYGGIRNFYYKYKNICYNKKYLQQIKINKKEIYTSPLYKSLGIKSIEEFYKDKFFGQSVGDFLKYYPMAKYDIRYSKVIWIYNNIRPQTTILDIGCGSGHLTVLHNKKIKKLVGVDISDICLQEALRSGYDEVHKADVLSLPFDNNSFDYVVSLDLFGHIEAKLKNKVISEIARVLKPKGITLHGIEEGKINYNKLSTEQKKEIIEDGHVGIETRDKTKKRFECYFKKVSVREAFGPCQDWDAFIKYSKCFPADFVDYIKKFNKRDIKVFSIAIGYVHNYFFERNLIDTNCFAFLKADKPIK